MWTKLREWVWLNIRSKTIHIIPQTKHRKPKSLQVVEKKGITEWHPKEEDFR